MKAVLKNIYQKILNTKKEIHNELIYIEPYTKGNNSIELSMKWTSSYTEQILCFTNNIYQKDGGTHLSGFKSALTTISQFIL
jgi:DNA gyrase subunit B